SKGDGVYHRRTRAVQDPPLAAGPVLHALLLDRLKQTR
ncbi:MAG TPA: 3'(2'),5'-bisphosphate nucleotidase CysQ, partial [Oceanicaulis sp.]|nr:3'(2'),5'-bisphosphate nucleotidase CysQ [Oceanicaulis sp.]